MSMSLKNACFNIWKNNYERKGINSSFKPLFVRYIGVENPNEYNDVLKTYVEKAKNCPYALFFNETIPMQAAFDIINYIGNELRTMDVYNLKTQDIVLFSTPQINRIFLESLDTVVNLALKQESFFNTNTRNDFILKLIVWTYLYVRPIPFENNYCPKCIYYGNITKHEMYFLMMLHLMTFDVLVINPLKDDDWTSVDTMGISELHKNIQILPIEKLESRIASGKVIEQEESLTLQLEREIEDEFLASSGVYRPWQFREGTVKSLFIKSSIIDLTSNYNEPARVRNGFKTEGKTVTVPNYLFQIDGQYNDEIEYAKLVNSSITTPNTLVLTDRGESLFGNSVSEQEVLKLTFCIRNDGKFDIEKLKKLSYYQWDKYRDSLEDFMLNKINDFFDSQMFKKGLTQTEKFNIVVNILNIKSDIIKMVDNFDYTDKVPKIVVFLEKEDFISDDILYLLGYINQLGFDIIIFNPSGLFSIDSVFNVERFNSVRLDTMKYDLTLDSIKKKKASKGIFKSLFG